MTGIENVSAPDALKQLKQWLVWRLEPNPKPGKKDLKVPYYAKSGTRRGWMPGVRSRKVGQGSPEEYPLLVTFDEAKEAAAQRGMTGVGLAMGFDCPVTALDFDHCVVDGVIHPDVEALVSGTYAEISPSGTGVRAFVKGNLGDRSDAHPDDGSFGFEVYNSSRFVSFTGNTTPDTLALCCENEVAEPSALLLETCEKRFGPRVVRQVSIGKSDKERVGLTDAQIKEVLQWTAPGDYHRWMAVGSALHHETEGGGEWLWDEWSQLGADYEGPDEIRYKWSTLGNYTGNEKTFWSVLREAQSVGCPVDVDTASTDEFDMLEPLHGTTGKFKIMSGADFASKVYDISWLIKGVLPKANLGFLYGPSGSGKTFATLDMCMAVAFGSEWNGRKVAQGQILYVVAEDAAGLNLRMRAYCDHNGIPLEDMRGAVSVTEVTPNLTHRPDMVDLAKEVNHLGAFNLIVIDTFSRATPGVDENDGKEVGLVIQNCTELSHRTGAMVLVVHHTGKDVSRGLKGSSKLTSDADVTLEVARGAGDDKEARSITVVKVKNGADGDSFGFSLNVVTMGVDKEGEDVTTCTVAYNNAGKVQPKAKGANSLKANQSFVKMVLAELLGFDSTPVQYTLLKDTAVKRAEEKGIGGKSYDHRKAERAVRESLDSLIAKKYVLTEEIDGGMCCYLPGAENADA